VVLGTTKDAELVRGALTDNVKVFGVFVIKYPLSVTWVAGGIGTNAKATSRARLRMTWGNVVNMLTNSCRIKKARNVTGLHFIVQ
jgi:hypothetical protein